VLARCDLCRLHNPLLPCSFCSEPICQDCMHLRLPARRVARILPRTSVSIPTRLADGTTSSSTIPIVDKDCRTCQACNEAACTRCIALDPFRAPVVCYLCPSKVSYCRSCLESERGGSVLCSNFSKCGNGLCLDPEHDFRFRADGALCCRRCDLKDQGKYIDLDNDTDGASSTITEESDGCDADFLYSDAYYTDYYGYY
jgi:hypothetical protein